MTDHDIQLLALGFDSGLYTAMFAYLVHCTLEERRAAQAARERQRILAADLFHSSLHRYQQQARYIASVPANESYEALL